MIGTKLTGLKVSTIIPQDFQVIPTYQLKIIFMWLKCSAMISKYEHTEYFNKVASISNFKTILKLKQLNTTSMPNHSMYRTKEYHEH